MGASFGQPDYAAESHQRPEQSSTPGIPQPRISPETPSAEQESASHDGYANTGGVVSASASVPLSSRVAPPADQAMLQAPPPQPRVYGRPANPEAKAPEQAGEGSAGPAGNPDQSAAAPFTSGQEPPSAPIPDFSHPAPFGDLVGNAPQPINGVKPHSTPPGATHSAGTPDPFDSFPPPASPAGPTGGAASFPGIDQPFPSVEQGGFGPGQSGFGPGQSGFGPGQGGFPPSQGFGPGPGGFPTEQGGFAGFPSGGTTTGSPGSNFHQLPGGGGQWNAGGPDEEQNRFDTFKQEPQPQPEQPTPKVRNGRVLLAVITGAILLLVIPLGTLWLLGKTGGGEPFNPAVGSCVKQNDKGVVVADCGEKDAYTVVSIVDAKDKCTDRTQPNVTLKDEGRTRVLCLKGSAKK